MNTLFPINLLSGNGILVFVLGNCALLAIYAATVTTAIVLTLRAL